MKRWHVVVAVIAIVVIVAYITMTLGGVAFLKTRG
jgi:hypothetical protein